MWQNKKVLVAGGEGFIGYNLAHKLKSLGADVTITSHLTCFDKNGFHTLDNGIHCLPCDLLKKQDCEYVTRDKDIVFMCAAITHGAKFIRENPLAMVTPNVIMNAQMIDASYAHNVQKFIFISSNAAYPDTQNRATCEDEMFNDEPHDVYFAVGWMKRYAEIMCRTYTEKIKNGMQCIVIRPSNIYGPYDDFDIETSHVTASLIRKMAEHQDPLEIWGDGNDIRDILYIDDFIDMTLEATEKIKGFDPINIAYGDAFSIKQILDWLCKIENFYPKVIYNSNKPSTITVRKIDVKKAESLGIKSKICAMNGLAKTLQWYKDTRKL